MNMRCTSSKKLVGGGCISSKKVHPQPIHAAVHDALAAVDEGGQDEGDAPATPSVPSSLSSIDWSLPSPSASSFSSQPQHMGRPLSAYTTAPTTAWTRATLQQQGSLRVYSTKFQDNNALNKHTAEQPIEFLFLELKDVRGLKCVSVYQGCVDCADVEPGSVLSQVYEISWLTSADIPRIRWFFDAIRTFDSHRGKLMPSTSCVGWMMWDIHAVESEVDTLLDEMDPPSQTDQSQQFKDTGFPPQVGDSPMPSGSMYVPPVGEQVNRTYPPVARFIKLKHLSNLSTSRFIVPAPNSLGTHCKPLRCLWLACGNTWRNFWAEQEGGAAYEATYTIDTNRLIILDSPRKVAKFDRTYGLNKKYEFFDVDMCIDWETVRSGNSRKCGVFLPRPAHYFGLPGARWVNEFDVCSAALWSDECITHVTKQRKLKLV